MSHLGKFGKPREPSEFTFDYFDATLRTNPDLSDVAVIDMFSSFEGVDGTAVLGALRGIATTLVHPDDVEEFWRLVKANRQTVDDIAELAMALISAATDRPTRLPADSSAGQSSTDTSSEGDSSSPALRLLEGRPDLQVAVLRAQQARQAG